MVLSRCLKMIATIPAVLNPSSRRIGIRDTRDESAEILADWSELHFLPR